MNPFKGAFLKAIMECSLHRKYYMLCVKIPYSIYFLARSFVVVINIFKGTYSFQHFIPAKTRKQNEILLKNPY